VIDLKNILSEVCPISKHIFIIGFITAILIVAVSAVLYFGAGRIVDYYPSVSLSEKLLSASRTVWVSACISALLVEYRAKACDKI
jgi:hypothetical protein